MPRDNGDFIRDLRLEIAAGQNRRAAYAKMKLTFLVGLFGAGLLPVTTSPVQPLLYLTTVVAFVFDILEAGEDFGIKRAGMFIKMNPCVPCEERRWERLVYANRSPAISYVSLLSSFIVLIGAAIALWKEHHETGFYRIWLFASVAMIIGGWTYFRIVVRKLSNVRRFLEQEFPRPSNARATTDDSTWQPAYSADESDT